LVYHNGRFFVVLDVLGRSKHIGSVNRPVVGARVVAAMVMVVLVVDDVMILVAVSVGLVAGVVINVVVNVGYLLGLADLVEGVCAVLRDVVTLVCVSADFARRVVIRVVVDVGYLLGLVGFVEGLSDCCRRVVVGKTVTGSIGFVFPDYKREIIFIDKPYFVLFCSLFQSSRSLISIFGRYHQICRRD
jgi:hypothetical protein